MAQKVFTSQKISLLLTAGTLEVQALVSQQGAKYVFEEADLPEEFRSEYGKEFDLFYKKIPTRARLIREQTSTGSMYSIRFIHPSAALTQQIENDLITSGLPSPWRRALARLSTARLSLPAPVLMVLYYSGQTFFLNVKNFTLGGMLCEYIGEDLNGATLGTKFEFDIVTNSGEKIANLTAVVCHFSEEILSEEGGATRRQFGIRFLSMGLLMEAKYKTLIRDHCVGLQKEPS